MSRAQVIVCLIHHGASVNFETHSHDTALIVAAQTANLDAIKSLVRLGAAVNYETKDGRTALTTAAMVGKVDAIEELIRQVRPPLSIVEAASQEKCGGEYFRPSTYEPSWCELRA